VVQENRRAEIAGAGIAGLTAATALAQRGWQVRVHERGDELREIGAGIFMWENALKVLEEIGAYGEATANGEHDRSWEIRDERMRMLQGGWMMADARLVTVLRSTLHRSLAEAARRAGAEIVTNSEVAGARADGSVILADGTQYKADLVIGADGIGSNVRNSLGLAERVTDLRDGAGRHLISRLPGDPEAKSVEYWDGGRRMGVVPVTPNQVYVYLGCPSDDRRGRAWPLDRESWKASFPHAADIVDRIPDVARWQPFADVYCRSWCADHVALLGDAAHAMSPNLGQGAGVAMQSGLKLAKMLEVHRDVPSGLVEWEFEQRPVVEATQKFSRMYGRIGTRWPRALLDVRSALVWGIGRSETAQRRINVAAHSAA
jgi:2-polyprenyl-6-methoxyphenol hydroxylase-like FAD-dependent oxidoreductase